MSRIGSVLLEFGVSLPQGHGVMKRLFSWLPEQTEVISELLMQELQVMHEHYLSLCERITAYDKKLASKVNQDEKGQLLKSIPGIGDMVASQCLADITDVNQFTNGRNMAAWMGLVPRQHSTGGKPTLLGISKRGNKHLRTLFIHGARAVLANIDGVGKIFGSWLTKLRESKTFNVATVALANKLARIAWAVLKFEKPFDAAMLRT